MNPDACEPSREQLIAIAQAKGVDINARWLAKYSRLGLLPPFPPRPGVGRGSGRPSRYAPSTPAQLEALLDAQARFGKNLSAIGWALWKQGFDVDPRYWKDQISKPINVIEYLKKRLSKDRYLSKNILRWLGSARLDNSSLSKARRQPENYFNVLIEKFLSVISGEYRPTSELKYDANEYNFETQALSRTLSIPTEAKGDSISANWPVIVSALDEQLQNISNHFEGDLRVWLSELENEEILIARDEFWPFWISLISFAGLINGKVSLPGLSMLLALNKNPKIEPYLFVGWLLVRDDPEFAKGATEIRIALDNAIQQITLEDAHGFKADK